jgi:hypothetical protein
MVSAHAIRNVVGIIGTFYTPFLYAFYSCVACVPVNGGGRKVEEV